jgi:hypothetical protein
MSLRKLGSFIKIKNNGIQPFKIENRMLKVWIDMETNLFCFNRIRRQKSLKQQKSDGYGGCFPSQFYYYSGLAYIKAQFKAKEMLEMG